MTSAVFSESLDELKLERAAGKLFRKSSFARFTFT